MTLYVTNSAASYHHNNMHSVKTTFSALVGKLELFQGFYCMCVISAEIMMMAKALQLQ